MRDAQRIKLIRAGIGKAEKAANRRNYNCIYPGCTENAIGSHSQQKKHQLESIAENSAVYSFDKNPYSLFTSEKSELLKKNPNRQSIKIQWVLQLS